jgi:HlyD family secretion protein
MVITSPVNRRILRVFQESARVVPGLHGRERPVKVGHSNGFKTGIAGGLNEGGRVIVYPGDKVTDGIRVEPDCRD